MMMPPGFNNFLNLQGTLGAQEEKQGLQLLT
jgi:hypothetical protein